MTLHFEEFYAWTKEELNLQLSGYKQNQLQRRITTIMKKSGAEDLKTYAKKIKQDAQVRQAFLDYITINVTEFYRNPVLFAEFERFLIEELATQFPQLKIWSAACSTGAEAYSIAIALKEKGLQQKSRIIATDIDQPILEKAQIGMYREAEIKNIDPAILMKYFSLEDPYYYLQEEIKKLVQFRRHDLILDSYEKGFHAIICRNVTIYFNEDVKESIYKKMSDALVPGGIFFIGATETIYRPEEYGLKKIGSFLYQKIE